MDNTAIAKKITDKGWSFIPLLPEKKYNSDSDFLTKDYELRDIIPNGNIGVNPKKSGVYVFDLDSDYAIKFGDKWLPKNTTIGARKYPDGRIEKTHYYFKSDGSLNNNFKGTPAELYIDHNIVAYGVTIHKATKEPMERFWESEDSLESFNDSYLKAFNLINFASMIAPHVHSANQGGLYLDSCIWRYCKDWTDEDRITFLTDFYEVVLPNNKHNTYNNWKRIVKANNNDTTNNAGYAFFADHLKVNKKDLKEWLGWIGTVHEDKAKKTYKDFTRGIDMMDLRTREIPPLKFAIDNILPEGLVLFCGRAKSMKSWTMLLISYLVQNGMEALGHKTTQGDCLYLGLEDSERRLKDRESKLGIDKLTPPYVDIEAPYLNMGLEESLQQWIDAVNNPRLIVIDTLARVKQAMGKRSGTAYDHDNETLRNIQKLAVKNGVTIVLVSHLNKAPQDYAFDKITGSTGLQGMCDAMWLCERGEHGAKSTLIGRGRDIMDFEYSLTWNQETWRYDYLGDLGLVTLNENRKEVLDAMKKITEDGLKEMRPSDVIKYCGYPSNTKEANNISKTMQRMKNDYELQSGAKYGTYKLPRDINEINHY